MPAYLPATRTNYTYNDKTFPNSFIVQTKTMQFINNKTCFHHGYWWTMLLVLLLNKYSFPCQIYNTKAVQLNWNIWFDTYIALRKLEVTPYSIINILIILITLQIELSDNIHVPWNWSAQSFAETFELSNIDMTYNQIDQAFKLW